MISAAGLYPMEIHRLSNRWSGFRLVYMATVTDLSLNDSRCDQTRKQNFEKGILRVKHISPVRVDMIRQVFNDGSPAQRTFKRHFLLALWTKKQRCPLRLNLFLDYRRCQVLFFLTK